MLRGEGGRVEYVIATGIDVTEQRRAEEEARQRQAEVAHMHRLYTAGELAAVLAHELNQPLTAIASYSEASLEELRRPRFDKDQLIDNLERIALQAQRAGKSLRQLRAFVSKDDLRKQPVDINGLVEATGKLLAPEMRALHIHLELSLKPGLPALMAQPVPLEHVLVNLLQNSIEAIRDAGMAQGRIVVRTARQGRDKVRVSVQDNGPGLQGEALEKAFQPFHTTKPQGLGMGLCISRSVVEAHGGRLWAEPAAVGALFHFELPLEQ